MIRFESDYLEGAVPEIMSRLIETNYEQTAGYGTDPYCRAAREKISLSAMRSTRIYISSSAELRQILRSLRLLCALIRALWRPKPRISRHTRPVQ